MGKYRIGSYRRYTEDKYTETKGKVYATGDWHGCADPALKVLDFLKPEDTLIFLGDAMDRGDDGYKLMIALMSDPRVIYLKGNHEAMMAAAIDEIWNEKPGMSSGHWYQNGGARTLEAMETLSVEVINGLISKLNRLPDEVVYQSSAGHTVICEHAGYSPFDMPHRSHDPQWDREHFHDTWDGGFTRNIGSAESTYLVHGHTPVQYLQYDYGYAGQPPMTKEDMWAKRHILYATEQWPVPEVIRYYDGHKFDIDMCTIATDRIALLDLDTFETTYFDTDKKEKR